MNIRPRAEDLCELAIQSFLQLRPVSQALFLAVGMFVPATDRRGLGVKPRREPMSNDEDAERRRAERKAKRRAHYPANREQELARAKAYRAANREKIRASQAAYREANREKLKADQKAYYAANREKRRAQMVAYRAARRAARKQPR
jgi:hypothetical protein